VPKVEGFKSLTPLGRSEKKPCDWGSSDFQKRASTMELGPSVYKFKIGGCKAESLLLNRLNSLLSFGLRGLVL
jgi:hypothetical protein